VRIGSIAAGAILNRMERTTGFARLGRDRMLTAGAFGAFDTDWQDPVAELYLRRFASFVRLIRFDRRGTGGSDLTFEDRGTHRLKGIEGDWPLFAVRVPG
jgi:hypothetical protein